MTAIESISRASAVSEVKLLTTLKTSQINESELPAHEFAAECGWEGAAGSGRICSVTARRHRLAGTNHCRYATQSEDVRVAQILGNVVRTLNKR